MKWVARVVVSIMLTTTVCLAFSVLFGYRLNARHSVHDLVTFTALWVAVTVYVILHPVWYENDWRAAFSNVVEE